MKLLCGLAALTFALSACATGAARKPDPDLEASQIKKIVASNPDIVLDILKTHPIEVAEIVAAGQTARREQDRYERYVRELADPLQPVIQPQRPVLGNPAGVVTIVSYSDFFCPYCARGAMTVLNLIEKYPQKLSFYFKHLPHSELAFQTALYFEAIARRDSNKAWEFHDMVFAMQSEIKQRGKESILELVEELELEAESLAREIARSNLTDLINRDIQEAERFGIGATPTFLINGVTVQGAYPLEEFEKVIRLVEGAKH